jgi:hypothetical protein
VGYAIAREFVLVALARLRAGPPIVWPWLGAAVETPADPPGTLVWSVIAGSPAATAGLRPGDRIVAINGKVVEHFLPAMLTVVSRPIGSRFEIEVQRPGPQARDEPQEWGDTAGTLTRESARRSALQAASEASEEKARGGGPGKVAAAGESRRDLPLHPDETEPAGAGHATRLRASLLSSPRAIEPRVDPLDLFERQTGIRLEPSPPSNGRPACLRVVSAPPPKPGEKSGCGIGSCLVGVVPGSGLLLALEEGRSDQEMRTDTIEDLDLALRASSVGDRVMAALVWETDGNRSTMFLTGEAKRYPIL